MRDAGAAIGLLDQLVLAVVAEEDLIARLQDNRVYALRVVESGQAGEALDAAGRRRHLRVVVYR